MYNNKTISLVIPCYNEEKGVEAVLTKIPQFIDEAIVVDNNSTDRTATVARKYGANVIHEKHMGYGRAYLAGFSKAKGDIIATVDGDNSYPLDELKKLLLCMEKERCDFVNGCRFPLIHRDAQPIVNKIANYFISWLIRILFKVNITDTQSGMMVFRRDILGKIKTKNTGMGFSYELKIKAFLSAGVKYGETHISYLPRIGKTKFRKIDSLKNFFFLFSLLTDHC